MVSHPRAQRIEPTPLSSRCATSLHLTRLCRPPDKLRQPQDPMSAHISASAPTAHFKLASPPRTVVPEQRTLDPPAASSTAGSAATLPHPQHVRDQPLGLPSLSFVSQPEPWSSTKHSPFDGSSVADIATLRVTFAVRDPASPGSDCTCSGIGRHHVRSASATHDSPLRPDGASSGHREVPTTQASAHQRASPSSTRTAHRRIRGAARQKAAP